VVDEEGLDKPYGFLVFGDEDVLTQAVKRRLLNCGAWRIEQSARGFAEDLGK
jgi:hypothetical protein